MAIALLPAPILHTLSKRQVGGAIRSFSSTFHGELICYRSSIPIYFGQRQNNSLAVSALLLRSQCGTSSFGNVFLGKCCVRFSVSSSSDSSYNGGKISIGSVKTFAIIAGLLAAIVILVLFFTFLCRAFGGGKHSCYPWVLMPRKHLMHLWEKLLKQVWSINTQLIWIFIFCLKL